DTSSASVSSHSPRREPCRRRRARSPSTQSIAAPSQNRIPAMAYSPDAAEIAAVTPEKRPGIVTWFGGTGVGRGRRGHGTGGGRAPGGTGGAGGGARRPGGGRRCGEEGGTPGAGPPGAGGAGGRRRRARGGRRTLCPRPAGGRGGRPPRPRRRGRPGRAP